MLKSGTKNHSPRAATPILVFIVVFLATCVSLSLTLRQILPRPDMLVLTPKLDTYQAEYRRFDTVFLGSSRTLYHIVPDAIEQSYREAGCGDISIFNFGVFGLNGTEQDWLLEQIIHTGDGSLQRLIIESPLAEAHTLEKVTNERGRWFHGAAHWSATLESIDSFAESRLKRIYRTGLFAVGAVYDLSGLGYASKAAFASPDQNKLAEFDMGEDGYEALDEIDAPAIVKRRNAFKAQPGAFDAALTRAGEGAPNALARADYLASRLERIEAAGLKTALYVSPDVDQIYRTSIVGRALKETTPRFNVFNYNDLDAYPEFYDFALWDDMSHMGRSGATMMSRKLGAAMCNADRQSGMEIADAIR